MSKKSNKGVQGDWFLFTPERVHSMLDNDEIVQKGEIIDSGPKCKAKTGDIVIVKDWQIERIKSGENFAYYGPGSSILHIL